MCAVGRDLQTSIGGAMPAGIGGAQRGGPMPTGRRGIGTILGGVAPTILSSETPGTVGTPPRQSTPIR